MQQHHASYNVFGAAKGLGLMEGFKIFAGAARYPVLFAAFMV
jgi:hypothetical protein